jgi:hypothetical protein
MAAYLVTGWLTFALAGIAGWYRFREDVDMFKKRRAKAKSVGGMMEARCNN